MSLTIAASRSEDLNLALQLRIRFKKHGDALPGVE